MTEPSPAVAAAIEGELRLLDPAVRARAELLAELLHPGFREIDSRGRHWTRETIIASLTADDAPRPGPLTASRMHGVRLCADLVHLTFDTEARGIRSHRSSLWRLTPQGWRLYFHQATPFADDPSAEEWGPGPPPPDGQVSLAFVWLEAGGLKSPLHCSWTC